MNRAQWYAGLRKPGWKPPDWAVPLVWGVLYPMILLAGWLVWRRVGWGAEMAAWTVQMVLNLAWPAVFMGLRSLGGAVALAALLWLSILACVVLFWPVSAWAAGLMLPYLLWVGFAVALAEAIRRRNP